MAVIRVAYIFYFAVKNIRTIEALDENIDKC